ncbi:MAG: hypothetical protein FWG13_04635 [Leptospirales bacterium]|nr:hypothetical protein [Leptospirales bacterium]
MSEILESLMLIFFGISWPLNIIKSWRAKTAMGKSFLFLLFVFFAYIFGILSKFTSERLNYVLIFYIANCLMVAGDMILYFRNRNYDKRQNT